MIESARAKEIIERFRDVHLAVLGDLMLDRYVYGVVNRISPEAPVPVVHVRSEKTQPGGSANVALNVRSLGGRASVIGLVGDDAAGRDLARLLSEAGIRIEGLTVCGGLQTTVKTRVLADRQQIVRVDREDPPEAALAGVAELAGRLAGVLGGVHGLVIEDYGKGVVCQQAIDAALGACAAAGIPVGLDPKDMHELRISGLKLATPNYKEACDAADMPLRDVEFDLSPKGRMPRIAEKLMQAWGTELLVITLGPHGMYIAPRGEQPTQIPTKAREVFDVSGAGDTVIATAMMALAAGATHREAASIANHAAGVVVGKVGTATCSPDELIASIRSR